MVIKGLTISLCATLFYFISCNNSENNKQNAHICNNINYTNCTTEAQETKTKKLIHSDYQSLDFFGIKLQGSYEDLTRRLYELPQLTLIERKDTIKKEHNDIMYFSHIVEFCGVPCGMNVRFRMAINDTINVHELTFITSQTDKDIITKFVSEISKHYGKPENPEYARYNWWLEEQRICARSFHAPEGGWTVYFCLF